VSERNPVAIPVASTYLSQVHLSQVHATQVLMQAINLNPNHKCWRAGGLIVGRAGGRWVGWTGAWDKAQFRGYLGEALMTPRRRGCALDALDALDAELSLIRPFLRCFFVSFTHCTPNFTHDCTHKNKLYFTHCTHYVRVLGQMLGRIPSKMSFAFCQVLRFVRRECFC